MKKLMKMFTMLLALTLILGILPVTVFADGSYYVDTSYMVLKEGQSGTITIGADNAAGRVDWSSSGAVSANGSAWLDNGVATIDVTANYAGTGYITVSPTNIATYDGEEIDYGYTIQVDVVGEDGGYTEGNNTPAEEPAEDPEAQVYQEDPQEQPQEAQQPEPEQPQDTPEEPETTTQAETETEAQPQPAASGDVLTDGNNNYDDLSEEERLYTNVEDAELYIIQFPLWADENGGNVWNDEVYNLDMLTGFDYKTVNYKNINVDTFNYKDLLQVFVLKNLETDVSGYYVLDNGQGFRRLPYVTANGKQYIVVDFPEDFVIPEGYKMVEITLANNTVQALQQIPQGAETPAVENAPVEEGLTGDTGSIILDKRTQVMLKGYETVVSPGLESADPSNDIYYIYCLVDGKTQLYSYDAGERTLQRASITVYNEIPTEPQTVIVYEPAPEAETESNDGSLLKGIGWNNMAIQMKVLLIALAVAILLILILIILCAVMSSRNRKLRKSQNRNNRKSGKSIPARASGKSSMPLNEDDDAFFSYVKTEKDDYDLDSLR